LGKEALAAIGMFRNLVWLWGRQRVWFYTPDQLAEGVGFGIVTRTN
jgi:hypothetical protein